MTSETYRNKLWNLNFTFCFIVVLALSFGTDLTEGIRWINVPSQIDKCVGETANLTWEYVKEDNEDIRQFQWRFNNEKLIAYRSVKNGLHVDHKYEGRIVKTGDSGILLENVSSKDTGSYTLYPVIAWEESSSTQSIWLNVIEVTIQQWCTCDILPISPEWSRGQTINVVTDGCSLEINSSFCCIKGPAIKCLKNDPQKLCVPIRDPINRIENATQSRNTSDLTENATRNRNVPEHTVVVPSPPTPLLPELTFSLFVGSSIREFVCVSVCVFIAPTSAQVEGTELVITNVYLPLINTIMLGFLCICGALWMHGKISEGRYHCWRIPTKCFHPESYHTYSTDASEAISLDRLKFVKEVPYSMEPLINT